MESFRCIHSRRGDVCLHRLLGNYGTCDADTPCCLSRRLLSTRKVMARKAPKSVSVTFDTQDANVRNISRQSYLRFNNLPGDGECENYECRYFNLYRNKACDLCFKRIRVEKN